MILIKFFSAFLGLFILCSGCQPSAEKSQQPSIAENVPNFSTTSSKRLYFQNIRSYYYDKEEIGNNSMNVYRFSKRVETEDSPLVNLAIADNWRHDEAYPLLEANSFFDGMDTIKVFLADKEATVETNPQEGDFEELSYIVNERATHYQFAQAMVAALKKKKNILYHEPDSGNYLPMYAEKGAKEAFATTFEDYKELISKR